MNNTPKQKRAKDTRDRRAYQRERYARLRADGRCTKCTVPTNGNSYCETHMDRIIESTKLQQKERILEGKCADCAKPIDGKSVRFCTKHLIKHRQNQRALIGCGIWKPGSRGSAPLELRPDK